MTVNVNNQSQSISENSSIATLLAELQITVNGIAVALNNEVISKENWGQITLKNEDQITIIRATQGG
ncbi:sulfur carrier protein ThiS [Aquimarina sp. D1M17]|uniref:sulfur carrier protein ThiS n=1 Tax=Aquimarina acroporae TaxID=2937283 RepID=UPI0020BEAE73|nr:sulfur carrier protein ThiS [Aquimarina acroporae]MCK8520848.1 sulfur carrier protein ThiS [Aquimarina acroporae]